MINLNLDLDGLAAVRQRFARLIPETQQQVLNGMAQVAYDRAQRQVDTHTDKGFLARSLFLKPQGDKAWVIGHNQQHTPYALFVHWGTRLHDIKPRDKKALRWPSGHGRGTQFIFARFVHHPGYQGDPWLVTAADEAVKQFDAIVNRVNPGA